MASQKQIQNAPKPRKNRRGPITDKQREARRQSALKAGSARWGVKRYAITLDNSALDTAYITTNRPMDVRQIAMEMAKDEYFELNSAHIRKRSIDLSRIREVISTVRVLDEDKGCWDLYGWVKVYPVKGKIGKGARVILRSAWYDFACEVWFELLNTGG